MCMKFSKIIVIASSIMLATSVCAQFNAPGGLQDKWGETDNNNPNTTIRRVGIGDFPPLSPPAAAFHINANLLTEPLITANNTFLAGEVFRTSGPSTNINAWRLFTGPGNGLERFSLTVPANSNDAVLSTVQNGAMRFETNGTQRLTLSTNSKIYFHDYTCKDCLLMTREDGELYTDNQIIQSLEDKIKALEKRLLEVESLLAEQQ